MNKQPADAPAADFRKDWEKRGKPMGALESLFEIHKDPSWINRNYRETLAVMESLKDVEQLSRLAAMSVELLPSSSLDVIVKEQAEMFKAYEGVVRAISDSSLLPLLRYNTDVLSQSAIRYIRESSPVVPPRERKPPRIEPVTTTPKPEVAKGGPAAIPPEQGLKLLDVPAHALSQLDAACKAQTAIVRSSQEWEMLKQMKSHGQTADISRWLRKRANEVIKSCKQQLQFRRGRKPKLDTDKEGYKCALRVAAALPEFERGFLEKKRLKQKYRGSSAIKSGLLKLGYLPPQVESLMESRTPLSAACHYIAGNSKTTLEIQTVQNYYSRFRALILQGGQPSLKPHA